MRLPRLNAALLLAIGACATIELSAPEVPPPEPASFLMPRANRGVEAYSTWFADTDGRVIYAGLSPFWKLWWERDGDSRADLDAEGDLLIARFDVAQERFLEPLRLPVASNPRVSVWDVLAHSSGVVCFTTYFDWMGCVDPETGIARRFEALGLGLNELFEGVDGRIYATRYSSDPLGEPAKSYGSVLVLTVEGTLLDEFRLENPKDGLTAAKSVAVDPASGEIWLNTDTFGADGAIAHETIHLLASGRLVSRRARAAELHFVTFDSEGRGFFAEVIGGQLRVRVVRGGRELASIALGPHATLDFVQDIQPAAGGGAVLALWSGRIFVIEVRGDSYRARELAPERPAECEPAVRKSLLYSAFRFGDRVYASLYCDARILRVPALDEKHDHGSGDDHAQ